MGRMKNESDEREREAPDETMNESMGVSSFVRISPSCSRLFSALHLRRRMRKRKVKSTFQGRGQVVGFRCQHGKENTFLVLPILS